MVALRSRRLDSLFGASLDDVDASHVRTLVETGVTEAFDLDFKAELYGRTDSDKRALAGDVAAMANTAGGVIVLGVAEDDQARASAAPGVELSDAEVARIRQVVASLTAPMPTLDVVSVVEDEAAQHGFLLLAVPRSPTAPHAVLVNDGLRYPRRNGATTRYLSEPEVAEAYRERLRRGDHQQRRLEVIEEQARSSLNPAEAWLVLSCLPDNAGQLDINHATFEAFKHRVIGQSAGVIDIGVTYYRATVGRRCFYADDNHQRAQPGPVRAAIYLHADGAGSYALRLHDIVRRDGLSLVEDDALLIGDEWLVLGVLSGLQRLGSHARDDAAAGGAAVVRAQIVPPRDRPTAIGHSRDAFGGISQARGGPVLAAREAPAELITPLDAIAAGGQDLAATAGRLADELAQTFGVTELGQLSHVGAIRPPYWGRSGWKNELLAWGKRNSVPTTDEPLGT